MEEGFAGFGAAASRPQLGVEKQELLPPALLSLVHLVSMLDTGKVPGLTRWQVSSTTQLAKAGEGWHVWSPQPHLEIGD